MYAQWIPTSLNCLWENISTDVTAATPNKLVVESLRAAEKNTDFASLCQWPSSGIIYRKISVQMLL